MNDTVTLTNSFGEAATYTVTPWDGLCCICHDRPGAVEVICIPGGVIHECHQCIVEAQLKNARECAASIPALERELAQLKGDG